MDRKKILIVDDDAGTRLTVRRILEFSKVGTFDVVEACSGEQCLEIVVSDQSFDIILLDIEMPDMDGFEACRLIREIDPEMPIIFVTAHSDIEYRYKGRKAGGDSFLTKPINKAALLSLVSLLLNASRRPQK